MATSRTSSNILWSTITSLVAGELLTKTRLYTEALHRLQDNDGALLGRIAKIYSDLTSTATGTKARIVGNVDMTSFNYNDGIALSGLTVIVDENTTTAQTCTFTNEVTGPSVLLSQLTAQCGTNLIWSLNDSGQLVCECQTIGTGSTIALGSGTAHSTIWPSPTITSPGAGTVNDGTSRIGFAEAGAWPGGTLRQFLVGIESSVSAIAGKVSKAGDTMTGLLTANAGITVAEGQDLTLNNVSVQGDVGFSTLGRVWLAGRKQLWRARVTLSDASQTVDVGDGDRFDLPSGAGEPASPRTITLDHTVVVPGVGETITLFWYPKSNAVGGGAQYTIRRSGGVTIATFVGSTAIDTGLVWADFEYTSAGWRLGKCSGTLFDGTDYYGVIGNTGT